MVLVSAATVRMIVTALLVASPDDVTSAPAIADFLTSLGGDTAMKTSRSMPSDPLPQIYPLVRDESEIIDYRFFAEKPTANGSVTAERVGGVFARKCAAKGGRIEPDDGEVARSFHGRALPPRGKFKHFWSGVLAVCVRSPCEIMGGYVAITFDNPELATKSDLGARLFSRISSMPTRTAVYAYRPERIRSPASFQAQQAARRADNVAEQRTQEAFRRDLAVGTETNCDTVIQIREPMAQIAVPLVRLTPNGQSTF
ncbi:hypothetical protein [Sphingomonas sp. Leaf20]|uniref:hypothetical protein n=1 Tax=Sphingomonas sp. Leaf20 TaxID=1735685 RepID=UPI0007138FE3|nr:hypothetical protein [Sphingomonas sp. Leaf20]KQM68579.1 hypothetical protein ASE72_18460 [Sphingomonas sp. Leaf20]